MSFPSEYDLASDLADYLLHGKTGDLEKGKEGTVTLTRTPEQG